MKNRKKFPVNEESSLNAKSLMYVPTCFSSCGGSNAMILAIYFGSAWMPVPEMIVPRNDTFMGDLVSGAHYSFRECQLALV